MKKAVFFERDGVLIQRLEGIPCLFESNQIRFFPDAVSSLKLLKQNDYQLIMVSNQSGVGDKEISKSEMQIVHRGFENYLISTGVQIDHYHYCTVGRLNDHCLKKPNPGMISLFERTIDISNSFMIGEKITDIVAGIRAGCKFCYGIDREIKKNSILAKPVDVDGEEKLYFLANSLTSCVNHIISIH